MQSSLGRDDWLWPLLSTLHTFGDDARVHEGGQREVGQHEECDHALVGQHPWMALHVVLAAVKGRKGTNFI